MVQEILEILLSGLTTTATAVGSGIKQFITSVMLNTAGDGLNDTAKVIVTFAGVSLALG